MLRRRTLTAAALGTLAAPALQAQPAWPRRPVRMLVGFAPGGFTDIVARGIAESFAQQFGQPFVVENRTGASGTIATDAVAKAAPDGSLLLLGHSTPNAVAAALFENLPYDPLRDLTPVAQVAVHPHLLVVPAASPHRTTDQLIAAARARPGALSYFSAGLGSVHHLSCEALARAAGVQFTHVPYRGSAPAMADLIAGRIDFTIDGLALVAPQIQEGRLRALAAGTLQRIDRFPELTTLREQGYGDIDAMSWVGVFGPAGLPAEITRALSQATDRALEGEGLRRALAAGGSNPAVRREAEFRAFIVDEIARYRAILGETRIPVT